MLSPHSHKCLLLFVSSHPFHLIRENTVNILFRNDTTKAPYPLVNKNCKASCPLGNFTMLTKDMVPEDIKAACGITSPFLSNNISISKKCFPFASLDGRAECTIFPTCSQAIKASGSILCHSTL